MLMSEFHLNYVNWKIHGANRNKDSITFDIQILTMIVLFKTFDV